VVSVYYKEAHPQCPFCILKYKSSLMFKIRLLSLKKLLS